MRITVKILTKDERKKDIPTWETLMNVSELAVKKKHIDIDYQPPSSKKIEWRRLPIEEASRVIIEVN